MKGIYEENTELKNDILAAVFYACRSISSQKTRDFEKNNYNDIRRMFF